ncbi:MAG: hypothetical protein E7224_03170 [Clostridiales bacterium]|nr:hypothetical protein [Clostridiales bacterium]
MMDLARKTLIFWDIDGTLMHCGSNGKKALNRAFFLLYGISDAFDRTNIGGLMDGEILHQVFTQFGVPLSERLRFEETYEKVLAEFLSDPAQRRILPGVPELLEALEEQGACHVLLTSNLRIGAYCKLRSVGLEKYFPFGGFGDGDGEKYDAALLALREAETRLQCSFHPDSIWVVGDTLYDVNCAKRMGAKSLAVCTGWASREELASGAPDLLLTDLSGTDEILSRILGR